MSEIQDKARQLTAMYSGKLASYDSECNCGSCAPAKASRGTKFIINRFDVSGWGDLRIVGDHEGGEGIWDITRESRVFIYPDEEAVEL